VVERLREWCEAWARRRAWLPRALVVAALVWFAGRLTFDPGRWTIFGPIDLAIHEAGHVVFGFAGEFVTAFGGTLLQCLAPLLAAIVLARLPDCFGVAFCGVWLGVNLHAVAHYMADARAQVLPLVTIGGGDAQHDWSFLFGQLGVLGADTAIAGAVRVLGLLVLWGSIAACGALVILIRRVRRAETLRRAAARAEGPERALRGDESLTRR
jgi:hypothetical protein